MSPEIQAALIAIASGALVQLAVHFFQRGKESAKFQSLQLSMSNCEAEIKSIKIELVRVSLHEERITSLSRNNEKLFQVMEKLDLGVDKLNLSVVEMKAIMSILLEEKQKHKR